MTLTNYWWLLIWILTGCIVISISFVQKDEMVFGKKELRWNVLPAIFVVLPYIVWAGFRQNFMDTGAYRDAFLRMPDSFNELSTYLATLTKDKGFYGFSAVFKCIFGNSDVFYFFVIAAIQILCIAFVFRKYSCNYWISIFLFIASTEYMSWVFNGMRQFTAVALIFATTTLIIKKKYFPVVITILIASTMHQSALLMIPFIFIMQGEAWNKKTLILIAIGICALIYVERFTNLLESSLADTQYVNVVNDWKEMDDDGTHPLRVLVYSMPMILAWTGRKQIKLANDPIINFSVNASILTSLLYLISMVTSGIFIGRLPIYLSLYATGILLPWEIHNLFEKQCLKLILYTMVMCYSGFYYYQMHMVWNLL